LTGSITSSTVALIHYEVVPSLVAMTEENVNNEGDNIVLIYTSYAGYDMVPGANPLPAETSTLDHV
jgi:hypothetical protein